jgi:hypothetical protein
MQMEGTQYAVREAGGKRITLAGGILRLVEMTNPKPDAVPLRELTGIARKTFYGTMTEEEVRNHVSGVGLLHLILQTNGGSDRLIGFAAYNLYGMQHGKILYLAGIAADCDAQGNGSFGTSVAKAVGATAPDYLVMRTQNTVIYHAASKVTGEIYPCIQKPPERVRDVAGFIAAMLGSRNYDRETFTDRGTYGRTLYERPQNTQDPVANSIFGETLKLDIDRGDSVILVVPTRDSYEGLKGMIR